MGTRINRAKFTTYNTDLYHVEKCIHTMDIPLARYIDTIGIQVLIVPWRAVSNYAWWCLRSHYKKVVKQSFFSRNMLFMTRILAAVASNTCPIHETTKITSRWWWFRSMCIKSLGRMPMDQPYKQILKYNHPINLVISMHYNINILYTSSSDGQWIVQQYFCSINQPCLSRSSRPFLARREAFLARLANEQTLNDCRLLSWSGSVQLLCTYGRFSRGLHATFDVCLFFLPYLPILSSLSCVLPRWNSRFDKICKILMNWGAVLPWSGLGWGFGWSCLVWVV